MRRTFDNSVMMGIVLMVALLLLIAGLSYRNTRQLNAVLGLVTAGAFVWLLGRSLSGRQKHAAELEERERQFQTLADSIPQLAWMANTDGHIFWYSRRWYDYTGTTPEQMEGWGGQSVHDPEELPNVLEQWKASISAGTPFDMTFPLKGQDGQFRSFLTRVEPVKNNQGRVVRWVGTNTDITERKQAEEALRESQQFTRRVLDNLYAFVGVMTVDGTLIEVNRAPLEAAGISASEVLGKKFWDCSWWSYSPEVQARLRAACESAAAGEVVRYDVPVRAAGETTLWIDFQLAPLRDTDGRITHLIPSGMDITERKQADLELANREAHLRRVINNQLGLVGVIDHAGILLEVDDRSLAIAKARREQVIGQHFADAPWWSYDPEVARQMREAMRRAFAGEAVRYDVSLFAHGAEGVMIDFMIAPVFGDDGEVEYLIPSGVDIRERYAAEQKLRENEARFRDMADNIAQLAWMANSDGHLFYYNQRWFDYTGTTLEEMRGWGWEKVQHPDHLARMSLIWKAALERGQPWEDTFPLRGKDGEYRWFLSRAFPICDSDGKIVRWFGTNTDITAQRQLAEELRNSEQRMRLATEATGVGIWEWNVHTGEVRWDAVMFQIFGIAPTTDGVVQYHVWTEAVLPEDLREQEEVLQDTARHGGTNRREFRIRRRSDGEIRYLEAVETVRTNDKGETGWVVGTNLDVTERKRAELALVESQRKLKLGIDVAAFALAEVDYVAQTIELSPDAARLFGLDDTATIVPRQRIHDLFHPEDQDRIHAAINNCLAPEGPDQIAIEFRIVLPDGTTRWLDVRKRVHFDDSVSPPKPLRSTMVARDVTQEKLLQSELIENRERLTLAMQSARMGAFQWEPETDIAQWDDQWSAVIGVDKDAPQTGKTFFGLVHPEDIDSLIAVTPRNPETQSGYRTEFRIVRPDGQLRWLAASGRLLPRRNGHPARLVGLNWDITEQKEFTERIRQGEERLRLAMNAAQLSLWEWDVVNDQISWAKELYERQSMDRITPIGDFDSFIDMVHVDDRATVHAAINKCLSEGSPYHCEFRMKRGDGSYRWVLSMAHLSMDGNNAPVRMVGVEMDITDRKRLEETLRQTAAELSEADRRKDEFMATLAHELRNPLAPIRNGLQIIKLAGANDTVELARSMMERQLTQMVRLVDDLLDVSRISQGKVELRTERLDVRAVIDAAVETSRPLIDEAGHDLEMVMPTEPIFVDGDATRLAQVVSNLLTNSAKYMHRGGHIRLTARPDSEGVAISVADTGIGIPPAMLDKVFVMFAQVDRTLEKTTGGLGIGLSLVKGLVQMHGGTIEARSEGEGKGSEFVVWLPVVIEASEPQEVDIEEQKPVKSSLRILVVDDNRDGANTLAMMLKMMGNDIRTAYDGQAGVDVAGEFRPNVALVDIGLPKLNGYEVARHIRAQAWGQTMVLIALTGWGQDSDREKTRDAGFNAHLVKPMDLKVLGQMLADIGKGEAGLE